MDLQFVGNLARSKAARAIVGAVTVGTAVVGLVADVLGLRSTEGSPPVAVVAESEGSEGTGTATSSLSEPQAGPDDSPMEALLRLESSLAARSSSGVLETCGTEAIILAGQRLLLYRWSEESGWVDFSELIEMPTMQRPIGLAVVDVPQDGKPDVLVSFERIGGLAPVGGVLTVPSTTIGCGQGYGWAYFGQADGSFTRVVPNLEVGSGRLSSKDASGVETMYSWNAEGQFFQFQGGNRATRSAPDSPADSDVTAQFVSLYGRFSHESVGLMLTLVEPGSPAEHLVKFLIDGKRASRAAGHRDGAGFPVVQDGETWIIQVPGSSTTLSDFAGSGGKIVSFSMNGIPLEKLVRRVVEDSPLPGQCTSSGVCVVLRGVLLGNRSTFVAVEVVSGDQASRTKFESAWIDTGSARHRQRAATVSVVNSPGSAVWGLTFDLAELPWGFPIEIRLKVSGLTETVAIQIPM